MAVAEWAEAAKVELGGKTGTAICTCGAWVGVIGDIPCISK